MDSECSYKVAWYRRNQSRQQLRGRMYYYQRMMKKEELSEDKRKEYKTKYEECKQLADEIPLVHIKRIPKQKEISNETIPVLRLKHKVESESEPESEPIL